MTKSSSRASAKILREALHKTEQVQVDLDAAVEELVETNSVLSKATSAENAVAAVADAVVQNKAAEAMVKEASDDLELVKELIMDAQVAQDDRRGRSGEGAASVVPHLPGARA